MTPEQRQLIRDALDQRVRERVRQETADSGSFLCDKCHREIENRRPGRRFCCDGCRKRFYEAGSRRRVARFGAHGTASTYRQGCRCDRCRRAKADTRNPLSRREILNRRAA